MLIFKRKQTIEKQPQQLITHKVFDFKYESRYIDFNRNTYIK